MTASRPGETLCAHSEGVGVIKAFLTEVYSHKWTILTLLIGVFAVFVVFSGGLLLESSGELHQMQANQVLDRYVASNGLFIGAQLEQQDFRFSPDLAGFRTDAEEVVIVVKNKSDREHTFTIDALDVDETVQPGETQEITIPVRTGVFDFYCRFHRDQAMKGQLQVNGPPPP